MPTGKPMHLTRSLRRLLEAYFVALAVLAALSGIAATLGGDSGALLAGLVLWGLLLAAFAWLIVAYYAGASPSTYLRPDTDEMIILSRSPGLVLPQDDPAVMEDLKEKLVGNQADIMIWAGANAGLCFGLGALYYLAPVVCVVGLVGAVVAIGTIVYRAH